MIEQIKNKFLLLDTNILIDSSKYPEDFQGFYDSLKKLNVSSVLDQTVKMEFMRGVQNKEQQESFNSFLEALFGKGHLVLQLDNSIIEMASKLAIIYGRNKKSAEIGDYFIAAQMCKYSSSSETLFLATRNNDDFPRLVFDRIHIYTIDVKKTDQIINIGIYKFNKENFDNQYNKFLEL